MPASLRERNPGHPARATAQASCTLLPGRPSRPDAHQPCSVGRRGTGQTARVAILSVTIPFFALVLIGYLAARAKILPLEAVPGLNIFVLYFALTAMLFQLAAQTPVATLLDPVLVTFWLVAGLLVLAIATATSRRRGLGWLDSSFGGLIAVLSNSGFLGVPILVALLGPQAGGAVIVTLLVDIVFLQSIALALSHRNAAYRLGVWGEIRAALLRSARNPLPWAIILGAAWGATGMALPGPVADVLDLLAAAATPVALFTIGAVLAREQQRTATVGRVRTGVRAFGDVYWLASLKLFVHPLVVWVLGVFVIAPGLPLSEFDLTVLVLVAALPSATNVSVLAERFGADNGRIARVILVSTALGFLTFSAAVALLA